MLPVSARAAKQELLCAPTRLKFGAVSVGQSETQLIAVTNVGQASTTVSAISVSDAAFSVSGLNLPVTLAAGESASLEVKFTPAATGYTQAKMILASTVSLEVGLSGTGVTSELLTAVPSSISFGSATVGTSETLSVVLTNIRTWNIPVLGFQTWGSNFTVSGPAVPLTLAPGQSASLSVTFTPQSAVASGGSVYISGPGLSIPFSGTGTTLGQLNITPTALNFGSVLVGESGTQTAVLSATGGSVTISSASSSGSQFALPGSTFPITIAAGSSVQLNVTFTPLTTGAASGKLSFSSNASDAQASESVAGTGAAPQVSLGWSPSTSPVQGYNVYRGTAPGVYTKINSSLDPNTTYTDTTVATKTTYYYAATAVNSSGQESTYSSPVEVSVP
jgi:hypothetical protein